MGRVRKHDKKKHTWRGSFLDAHDIEPAEDGLFRTSTEEDMLADDGGDIPRPAISEDLLEWLPSPWDDGDGVVDVYAYMKERHGMVRDETE